MLQVLRAGQTRLKCLQYREPDQHAGRAADEQAPTYASNASLVERHRAFLSPHKGSAARARKVFRVTSSARMAFGEPSLSERSASSVPAPRSWGATGLASTNCSNRRA